MIEGKASGAKAKLAFRYLRAILNYANAKFGDDGGTPIAGAEPGEAAERDPQGLDRGRRRRTFVKPTELKAWFEAVQSLDGLHLAAEARDCLLLGLLTGVRPSEALGLRWADVDFANATLTFRNTKNGTDHELPLTALARGDAGGTAGGLRRRPRLQRRGRNAAQGRPGGGGTDHRARPASPSCRPTCAGPSSPPPSGWTSAPIRLKRMLNHAIGGDVTSGYIVPTTERLREPMQRVEDFILGQAGLGPTADVVPLRGPLRPVAEAAQ